MAYMESSAFCSLDEYEQGLDRRVHESDIRIDELYTFALRLDSDEREVAKLATRPLAAERSVGMAVVRFSLLDADLNPRAEGTAEITNGIANKVIDVAVKDPRSGNTFTILQGYFRDYFEDQFGGILERSNELTLTG
jgi:hypothetical protein